MYVKSFSLQNFQSHKSSHLEFAPGLNVIIGPTNSGKSAIIRGLKKLFTDFPKGTGFITHNENVCDLTLILQSDEVIRRILKTRGETPIHNEYSLAKSLLSSDLLQFFSFGTEIPPEIRAALYNREAELIEELDDIRFGNQLDPPFLLSLTPSSRARIVSRISGVDILDKAAQIVNREAKSQSRTLDGISQQISQTLLELEKFKDLPEWERQLAVVKELTDKVPILVEKREKIQTGFQQFDTLCQRLQKIKKASQALWRQGCDNLQEYKDQIKEVERLILLQKQIRNASVRFQSVSLQQNALGNFVLLNDQFDFKGKTERLLERKTLYRIVLNLYTQYQTIVQAFEHAKDCLATAITSLNESIQELQDLKIELKVCPVCERPF